MAELLARYPQQARRIALEVPEFALYSAEHAIARLALKLQPFGVDVGIDQVGTGTMAFAYLQRLPLAYVRIDGSFNRGVHLAQDHKFYIQSMVQIAHNRICWCLRKGWKRHQTSMQFARLVSMVWVVTATTSRRQLEEMP